MGAERPNIGIPARTDLAPREIQPGRVLEDQRQGRHTSLVARDVQVGLEPLARVSGVAPERAERVHGFRPGEHRLPVSRVEQQVKRPKTLAEREGTEKSSGTFTVNQLSSAEQANQPDLVKTFELNNVVNQSQTADSEQKNTSGKIPILEQLLASTKPLEVTRNRVLDGSVDQPTIYLVATSQDRLLSTAEQNQTQVRSEAKRENTADPQHLPRLTFEANFALEQARTRVELWDQTMEEVRSLRLESQLQLGLKIVTGAEARAALLIGETAQLQKAYQEQSQALNEAFGKDKNQALMTDKPISKPDLVVPELQTPLNPIEDPQLLEAYQALVPVLGPNQALETVGKSVEQRVQALNPEQQLALMEQIIKQTEPEELLAHLPEDERWKIIIFVKRRITECKVKLMTEIDQEVMDDRERAILAAWYRLFQTGEEIVTGAEFLEEVGTLRPSKVLPEGVSDGGIDHFDFDVVPRLLKKGDLGWIMAKHEENKAINVVKEEEITTRKATDQEVHRVWYEQIGGITGMIRFAKQRAMVMFANLPLYVAKLTD